MSHDVSIRELRNDTPRVIERVERGETLYLTKHGRRIAEIHPVTAPAGARHRALLDRVAAMPKGDSGLLAAVEGVRQEDAEAERDLWG